MNALHHLDLNVTDLELSARFYGRILPAIGYRQVSPDSGGLEGFDWIAPEGARGDRFSIGLLKARHRGSHDRYAPGIQHLAFKAPTREAVDALHRVLVEIKAEILDPPREYPQYEAGYYAVFFLDPDGIKLEYVFTPESA